jgi:hypothetical protein
MGNQELSNDDEFCGVGVRYRRWEILTRRMAFLRTGQIGATTEALGGLTLTRAGAMDEQLENRRNAGALQSHVRRVPSGGRD